MQAFAQGDPLVRAHELYNRAQYDEAIQAATEARKPPQATSAAIVLARAHLERYRLRGEAADLDAARQAIVPLDASALAPRPRLDWTLAMAELLYFDRRFSTAAEFFDLALARAGELEPQAREGLFEWWASALDQQAQLAPEPERRPIYQRILSRAEDEQRRDDRSIVTAYWLSAASVGVGDLDRAWAAAEAGWLRGGSSGASGAKLRDDLDRLVATVIIPERVRRLALAGDLRAAMALMQQTWEEMKQRYGKHL